ncbi:MAG: DctP family TRAP transporter solute-binding subunit [Deltaproteobacteria bacterium]|jgi:tripartite ATP-independent transporter DctP family solute receptor|nr:DctP family TRAP transporter solute-binding subunit [Deltaproteobacteria bacterium]
MKKLLATIVLALVVSSFSVLCQAEPLTLKAGHTLTSDHPYHLGLLYLADLLKERTKGEVILQPFPDSMLGSEQELIEYLQMGTVDVTCVSSGPLSGFTDAFLVLDLPFIFPDAPTARRVLDGPIGQKILDSVENIDLIGLTFFENGFRHLTNSARPIVVPEDAKGLKIRTMQSQIHRDSFKAIGADPIPLPFGELFPSLKNKSLDGQENPIPIIYNSKFYEVQGFCSLTGHFYSPTPVFVSKTAWQKLTDEQKTIFREAAKEARDYQRKLIDEQNAIFVDKLKELGMRVDEVDKALWLKAMEPVYELFRSEGKAGALQEVQDEMAKGNAAPAP